MLQHKDSKARTKKVGKEWRNYFNKPLSGREGRGGGRPPPQALSVMMPSALVFAAS